MSAVIVPICRQPKAASWFARWVQRRADKNRRFKRPRLIPTADLRRGSLPRGEAGCDLRDVPDHLRADLGLDGGAPMMPSHWLGSSQMYYDRIIGSAGSWR